MAKTFIIDIPNVPAVLNTKLGPEQREWLRLNHNTDYNTLIFQETGVRPEKLKLIAPEDAAIARAEAEAEAREAEKAKARPAKPEPPVQEDKSKETPAVKPEVKKEG